MKLVGGQDDPIGRPNGLVDEQGFAESSDEQMWWLVGWFQKNKLKQGKNESF